MASIAEGRPTWAGRCALPGMLCALALLAGCDTGPAPGALAPSVADPAVVARGRLVYNFRCYYCHGYSGDAKTLAASYLTPPPRDFQAATAKDLSPERIREAVRLGRPGTAMKPFSNVIPESDVEAVTAFVFDEFVTRKGRNTRYHTPENGWPNHERYREAWPFALGEIALTEPPEQLSLELQRGRILFMESCISCHDRGKPVVDPVTWTSRPLSYPRNNYDHRQPEIDAATSATPYRLHDVAPTLRNPSEAVRRGEKVFQDNCAFCHAADGTGKNWIGAFLEPHPRNLTDPVFMARIDRRILKNAIREGVPDSSMPAWKSVLTDGQIDDLMTYIDAAFHPVRP